jgi:hypothetical protein
MITFLVRHGDAGAKRRWDGPDAGRPLSPAGLDQAEGLVLRLEDYPVDRILCSPTVRCQQTVQPLARDRLLETEPAAALDVDAEPIRPRSWSCSGIGGWPTPCSAPTVRPSVSCSRSSPGKGWSPPSRCTGRRVRPGCCTAPTGGRFIPATCPRWHWTADCTPADR